MSSIVCPFCKAENRNSAKFCLACAKQMVDLETGELLSVGQRRKRRSSRSSKGSSSHRASKARLALACVALLLFAVGVWSVSGQSGGSKDFPLATPPALSQATEASSTSKTAPPEQETPVETSLGPAESLVSTNNENTEIVSITDQQAEPTQPAPIKPAKEVRTPRKTSTSKHTSTDDAGNSNAQEVKVSEPLPPPAPVASSRPQTAPSPEQSCQGTAFFNKAYCLQKQCASQPNHPQCKKLAETQDAMRKGSGGG